MTDFNQIARQSGFTHPGRETGPDTAKGKPPFAQRKVLEIEL